MAKLERRLTYMPCKDITAYELAMLFEAYVDAISTGPAGTGGLFIHDDCVFEKYPELKRHFHDLDSASHLEEEA